MSDRKHQPIGSATVKAGDSKFHSTEAGYVNEGGKPSSEQTRWIEEGQATKDMSQDEWARHQQEEEARWRATNPMAAFLQDSSKPRTQSKNSESGGKVGPVVAFVAAAAVVLGIKSCMSDAPPSRTTAHTADSSSPVYEPAGQRAPLKTYVKPDGQPVRMWADFQKSQLRVTIPEGACIEVLDKDHAFGMSSVTIQYNSGRYEHGLIEQTAKVIPAPECNNTMR